MTTEQAVKIIASHLEPYIDEIPKRLLDKIGDIINQTRTIIRKEIILEDRKPDRPDLKAEWERICKLYHLDPIETKRGRQSHKITAKTHFVRYILLNYEYVNLVDLAKFFGMDHTSIIHLRDRSKVDCPYPPFYQRKRYIINAPPL